MALYRGPGGAGDATADSSTEAEAAVLAAAAAAVSETNAANSAAAAAGSAGSASTSADNAATSAAAAAAAAATASPTDWSHLTGTPTTLAGYGITDALPLSGGTVSGALTVTGIVTSNTNFKVAGGASQVMEFGTLGSAVYLQSYGAALAATPIDFYTGTTIKMTLSAAGDLSVTGAVTGSNLNIANWNTAYGWGNHASAGYLTSQTSHADVVVDGDFASNGILKRTALGVYGIVTDNSANWDTAYSWGNHAGLYSLTSHNHSGTYLPLTGGTLSGALNGTSIALSGGLTDTSGTINMYRTAGTSYLDWSSGQALSFSTVTSLGSAGRVTRLTLSSTGVATVFADADAGLFIDCSPGGTWAGLNMKDSAGADNIWFYGTTGTFAIGGGGSTGPSGKKLHVDGGTSIGANADATAVPTNGLYVEGNIESDGSIRAHVPLSSQSAAYTLVSGDGNTIVLHPAADTTARTFTIPANSSVAYPVGTVLTFINQNAAGTVTIAITTDTMRLAGDGTTGSRTLAANGIAVATKITSTEWIISGTGLT